MQFHLILQLQLTYKMVDYIIVGLGLSGLAVAEELRERGKTFVIFEDDSQKSSYVAGGIFNPVILKRFTPAWKAAEQLEIALPFYRKLEARLNIQLINNSNIYRRFHSIEEQNDWFIAADRPNVAPFLDPSLKKNTNPNIKADHFFGKVLHTGNINTEKLLDKYRNLLAQENLIRKEKFNYENLNFESSLKYDDIEAEKIIFCEGFGLKHNPFFNYLPLNGNKGEYIIIKSTDLKLDFAIKSSVFVMPLGSDLYKVGATYEHIDKSPEPTQNARERLTKSLKDLISCDFEVVDQIAGIRPAVSDRRPVIGKHPELNNLYCCNGFGSRGVLIAPYIAPKLLNFIEENSVIDPEIDLARFTRKHFIKN